MDTHLTTSQLEQAARSGETSLPPEVRAHLRRCEVCRRRKADFMPEPSEETAQTRDDRRRDLEGDVTVPPDVTGRARPSPPRAPPPRARAGPAPQPEAEPAPGEVPPAEAPEGLARGATVGRYLILDLLGEGGMGSVYAAYDGELDRKVAVKVLRVSGGTGLSDREGQLRLMREAQAMARISHPNVLTVHDVGTVGDQVFIAMELIDGQTLKGWLKEQPRTWREIVSAYREAGRGLAAAHAAGLVHRDFKPENVLRGKDGRIHVTDFGLARLTKEDSGSGSEDGTGAPAPKSPSRSDFELALASPLTQAGSVMGTPSYMPPEQYLGVTPDARSDQFSFCAALYRALWGARPFEPRQLRAEALDPGSTGPEPVIKEPPGSPKIPARIRKAIMKGLSLPREGRHPSMEVLLDALGHDPTASRGMWLATACLALLAVVGLFALREHARSRDALCSGSERMLAGAWDPGIRASLTKDFLASGAPDAKRQLGNVTQALDHYASDWAAMQKNACLATRVLGNQTEQVLDLRTVCLDRRLNELRQLTALLTQADAKMVGRSVEAVLSLPSIQRCADVAALSSPVALPTDPAQRKKIRALQARLAQAQALKLAGRYQAALKDATALLPDVKSAGYRPLQAETLYATGVLQRRTGKLHDGRDTLLEALYAAEAGRDDPLLVRIASRLIYVASRKSKFDLGHMWAHLGRAALERIGGNAALEGDLFNNLGILDFTQHHYDDARTWYEQSLKLLDASLGKDNPTRLNVLANSAAVYTRLGQPRKAASRLEEAIALMAKLRGPDHPSLAGPLASLANTYMLLGDFPKAHRDVSRAIAIARAAYGPKHRLVASFLDLEGTIFEAQDDFGHALEAYRKSLAIQKAVLGPNDSDLSYSYDGIGQSLVGMNRPKEAVGWLEKALKLRGSDPEGLGDSRFGLAKALFATGERKRALQLAKQAEASYAQAAQKKKTAEVRRWLAARLR